MRCIVALVFCAALLPVSVLAAPIFDGLYGTPVTGADLGDSRATGLGGGLTGNSQWAAGFTVTWDISFDGLSWVYEYVFTGLNAKDVSNFVLDLSDDCILPGGGFADPLCLTSATLDGAPIAAADIQAGNINGIPGSVKFDVGGGEGLIYRFLSNRVPVWGHLAMKDGGGSATCDDYPAIGGTNIACNDALLNDLIGGVDKNDSLNFVARPNGPLASLAPEPGVMLLLSGALLALVLFPHPSVR